jgi:nucleoside-diphosphate-sugar epimerase
VRRPVCLVTGATGAIGPAVVAAMASTHDVRTLSRRPPESGTFTVPVATFFGDVADRGVVRSVVDGVDLVVHLAARLHVVDPDPRHRQEYERVNVRGTESVVAAAAAAGVSRVVLMSTIAVYGSGTGETVDEGSATRPVGLYAETKLAAEQVALAARRADGVPLATVLRAAAVYGPRIKGNYERLARALSRRRFVPIGRGDNLRTVVYEQDLAAAVALAAWHPLAAGRIYNVSDGKPRPLREIIAAICRALDRPAPAWHLPVGPARIAGRLTGLVDRRLPSMVEKYLEEAAVDAGLIQRELGFRPQVGLADGWSATIAEMRRLGRL